MEPVPAPARPTRMTAARPHPVLPAVVAGLLLALVGCGEDGVADVGVPPGGTAGNEGGMGVPQQPEDWEVPGGTGPVRVRVSLAPDGCFLGRPEGVAGDRYGGEPLLVVWPPGTQLGDSGDVLVLPRRDEVTDGAQLAGTGAIVRVGALPGYDADGYWAMAVGFCTPGAEQVLVLDDVAVGPPR